MHNRYTPQIPNLGYCFVFEVIRTLNWGEGV